MTKKNLLTIGVAVLLLALLVGGALWFWTLGNPTADRAHAFSLQNVQGSVEVQRGGVGDWKAAVAEEPVAKGDAIRTGQSASVEINWDQHGVTRLDANTQMTIEDAPADAASSLQSHTTLRLDAGRVWSRLLKLLDVQSSFSIKTDTTVATVRGTTFGFARSASGTRATVAESVVSVSPLASGSPATLLRDRQIGDFTETGVATSVRDLPSTDEWSGKNGVRDRAFDVALRKFFADRDVSLRRAAPEWLIEMSERAHLLTTATEKRPELIASYFTRRLVAAQDDPSHARAILGSLDLGVLRGPLLERALRDVRDRLFLNESRTGFAPDFGIMESLRSLRISMLTKASNSDAYARALVIDDAIDAVLFPVSPLSADDVRSRVIDLNSQITIWERAFATTDPLRRKAESLRDRLSGFGSSGGKVPSNTQIDLGVPTSTIPSVAPTGTTQAPTTIRPTPVIVPQTPTTTIQAPSAVKAECVQPAFFLVPSPASVQIGQVVALQLFETCLDGSVQDLTTRATFTLGDGASGVLTGTSFVPTVAGSLLVRGTVMENNMLRGASANVDVKKVTRSLTGVRVIVVGSSSLTTGQSSPLDAMAVYSDGTESDIKYQCAWSTSDSRIAMVSDATFISLSGTGVVSAICTYTEGNVTTSGSSNITISLDPSLTPTNGSSPTGQPTQPSGYPFTYVP